MTEYEEIIEVLKHLEINSGDESYDVAEKLRRYDCNLADQISVSDGASKICFVFRNKPFVVKWSTYGYKEAMEEVEIYNRAMAQNLAKFFPKTAFLARVNGIDFVVQEKIDKSVSECNRKDIQRFQRISKTATDKIVYKIEHEFQRAGNGYHRSLDHDWAKMAIVLYGKHACKALCEFVIDNDINDLHGRNIGYKDGKPIILDFSGYHR